jgi:hypothetical protein
LRATGYIVKQYKETTTFSQGGREGFEKEGLEEMINKIMRLGRVRGDRLYHGDPQTPRPQRPCDRAGKY